MLETRISPKRLTRSQPRDLAQNAWYYANDGSVDLVTQGDSLTRTVRLKRAWLVRMLADMRPPTLVSTNK